MSIRREINNHPRFEKFIIRFFIFLASLRSRNAFSLDKKTLILVPHPDDECFGCGQLIYELTRKSVSCDIVIVSDGSASHALCGCTKKNISQERRKDCLNSLSMLGVQEAHVQFWDFPDDQLNLYRKDITLKIRECLGKTKYEAIYAPHQEDMTPDHVALACICSEIASEERIDLRFYITWAYLYSNNYWRLLYQIRKAGVAVASEEGLKIKIKAIDNYLTHIAPCSKSYAGELEENFVFSTTQKYEFFIRYNNNRKQSIMQAMLRRLFFNKYTIWIYALFANYKELLLGLINYIYLRWFYKPKNKSILLVEFNQFHGEVLPGIVYYFNKLGYKVTLLTRYCNYIDSPFVRFTNKPQHFSLHIWGMRSLLRSSFANQFHHIHLNSSRSYLSEYRYSWRTTDFIGKQYFLGKSLSMMEHEFIKDVYGDYWQKISSDAYDFNEITQRTFLLTPCNYRGHLIPMLNAHHFGDCCQKKHDVSRKIFITIGAVSRSTRNFTFIMRQLLLLPPEANWEFWIIGKIRETIYIPHEIQSKIKFLGRLSFKKMYEKIESADFFLPLLEPETQAMYLQGATSGSRQLILGFCIPPIIHEVFAEHYGFTADSCLVYNEEIPFSTALRPALTIDNDKYKNMRLSLKKLHKEVENDSLNNLRKMIMANESIT